ncbi:MAG TPA: hypothetical protein VHO91_20520 [Rhodopila sp.]|nr:hypothetical protein [Rhodopila sp.]
MQIVSALPTERWKGRHQDSMTLATSSATRVHTTSMCGVSLTRHFIVPTLLLVSLASCGPNYSPDTYSTTAVQQANKAYQGVIVGVRDVSISASGTVGTVTGAAAGGIAGAQVGIGTVSAFSALGGSLVGGIAGSAVEHATADTTAYEYIVRKANGDLVSVTQKDKKPLAVGQKVLVIAGNQARVLPDYTVALPGTPAKAPDSPKPDAAAADNKLPPSTPNHDTVAPAGPGAQPVADAATTKAPATANANEPPTGPTPPVAAEATNVSAPASKPVQASPAENSVAPAATSSPVNNPGAAP